MSRKKQNRFDVESLVNELSGIKDINMRMFRINEKLKEMDPGFAAAVIASLLKGNSVGKARYSSVYRALIKNRDLTESLGYEKISEIYAAAKEKGHQEAIDFLRGSSARKKNGNEAEETTLSRKLQHLTLGEKKAYARMHNYKNLEFLLHDTDPTVINNILKNPKITEKEVIRIASNRNAPVEVLEEVFRNDKWSSNYRVRKALIFNEKTPLDVALNLCSFMLKQDLKQIIKDAKLDKAILERAGEILEAKK